MGYSTENYDVEKALKESRGFLVVSASDVEAFRSNSWKREVVKAEKVVGEARYFFRLDGGKFVEVEGSAVTEARGRRLRGKKCDKCGVRNRSVVSRYDVNLCSECASEYGAEEAYENSAEGR